MSEIGVYLKNKNMGRLKRKYELFIAGSRNGSIHILANSLEESGLIYGHSGSIWCLEAINNTQIASGSKDKSIKIWDIYRKHYISTLKAHTKPIYSLCSPAPNTLISGSSDCSLIVWDLGSMAPRSLRAWKLYI